MENTACEYYIDSKSLRTVFMGTVEELKSLLLDEGIKSAKVKNRKTNCHMRVRVNKSTGNVDIFPDY
jgi:hypothetical protein